MADTAPDLRYATTKDTATFDQWLEALDKVAPSVGYISDHTLTSLTGKDCWRDSYDQGLTPAEAIEMDEIEGQS